MDPILRDDEIVVHIVGTKTSPESIDPLGIEYMPEVAIELLSSLQKIHNIIEPIVLIDTHSWNIWNLDELK
jgi:hypothetical protein